MKKLISVLTLASWLMSVLVGCNSESVISDDNTGAATTAVSTEQSSKVISGTDPVAQAILSSNLEDENVAAAADTLTASGYLYRSQESLVMIVESYEWKNIAGQIENSDFSAAKNSPGAGWQKVLSKADTLVWQVFENAQFDSSKHTTIATAYHDGLKGTILMELDISNPQPEVLTARRATDGVLLQDDGTTKAAMNRMKEAIACCAACAAGCILSGPGYAACVTACCFACVAYALVMSILDYFWPDKILGGN